MNFKFGLLQSIFCIATASWGIAGPPDDGNKALFSQTHRVETVQQNLVTTDTLTRRTKAGDLPISVDRSEAQAGGTFLNVSWTLSQPVGAYIVLCEDSEFEIGYDESGFIDITGPCLYKAFRGADEDPQVLFPNLDPNRKYTYAILPENDLAFGNGQVIPHYRTAKTLQRKVHLKVTQVDVIDDSDDFSDGELAFSFQLLPSQIHPEDAQISDFFDAVRWPDLSGNEGAGEGYLNVCSGQTLYPSVHLNALDVGDAIAFAVSVYDDDVDGVYDVTQIPEATDYLGAFDAHHGEGNSSFWILKVDGGTFESETEDIDDFSNMEKFQYKLVAKVSENEFSCLEYKVHFTVSVSYVSP